MKNVLTNLIKFFALCGLISFALGFVNLWAFLSCAIFVGAAMVCGILRNAYK